MNNPNSRPQSEVVRHSPLLNYVLWSVVAGAALIMLAYGLRMSGW